MINWIGGRKSALRTANGQASLQVEGIGEIGKCRDVKFCPGASTDLVSVSKLKAIGLKISFGDEDGPARFRLRGLDDCVRAPAGRRAAGMRGIQYDFGKSLAIEPLG